MLSRARQAITEITETDIASSSSSDPKLATYCAATLVNLACADNPEVLNAMFEADVTNIVAQLSNHHATNPSVLLCCCITLCHLSRISGARVPDMIVNSGMHALIATNSIDVHECKKAAVAAMANLVQVSVVRSQWRRLLLVAFRSSLTLTQNARPISTFLLSAFRWRRAKSACR